MTEANNLPRIVNAKTTEWGNHPRFEGVKMKALLTPKDNELANVSMVRVPFGSIVGWHAHATQVETDFVLAGQAVLTIGTIDSALEPGCIVAIPIGTKHTLRNAGTEDVELLAFFTPPNS